MSTLIHTRRKHPPTQVESNLTSMIDVVFLLIVFFCFGSQVVSREAEPLDLPEVPDAAAAVAGRNLGWWSTCCPMPNSQALVFAPYGVGATFLHRCRRLRGVGREGRS